MSQFFRKFVAIFPCLLILFLKSKFDRHKFLNFVLTIVYIVTLPVNNPLSYNWDPTSSMRLSFTFVRAALPAPIEKFAVPNPVALPPLHTGWDLALKNG